MNEFNHESLRRWFLMDKRDLPWRQTQDPYAVWVSEVMLQQTRVSVVIPYFERWMSLFPTIESLAGSSLDEVIKAWEGLGYYSRARNLHNGAQYVVDHFGGKLPEDPYKLKNIKGLGPYTIGAICNFAFHHKTPAVDGNVIRVLSRFFMVQEDISKSQTIKKIWELAESILPDVEPWVINEALIELGATLCGPKPRCGECPLRKGCKAYQQGNAEALPYKAKKVKIEKMYRTVAVISFEDMLLVKRGEKGEIMSDLHEFPYFDCSITKMDNAQLIKRIKGDFKLAVALQKELNNVKQSFTRYQVQLFPVMFSSKKLTEVSGYQWKSAVELKKLAFSSGHRRIFEQLS